MDPRIKNIRKDPFASSRPPVMSNQTDPEPKQTTNTANTQVNPPPIKGGKTPFEGVSQPISSTTRFTTSQPENKQDEITRKEYEYLKSFNSSKSFIRLTSDKLPGNSTLFKESAFPIGLLLHPYNAFEGDLALVNYGEKEIPRCASPSCRGYINPFVKWSDGGEKWICNLCKHVNDTAEYFYGKLDKQNNRTDLYEKADLSQGSYEFLANQTYMKKDKPTTLPVYVFIIDTSLASIQNGYLSAVIESIKDLVNSESFNNIDRVKVAIITYDSSINFYCMHEKLSQPQMLCISDEDTFLPCPVDSLLVNPIKSRKILLNTLDLIQSSYTNNSCKDSTKIFSAINAGYLLSKTTGGKLLVFNASVGMIQTPKMKSSKVSSIAKDEIIYTPTDDKQLSNIGVTLTNENISCDLFVSCDNYVNLITLNQLCDYTNGNLFFYKNFRIETHYKNIFNQIRKVATRSMCLETVVRTRFSKGFKIGSFIVPVLISNNDLIVCSTLDSDQSYAFGLEMSETPQTGTDTAQNDSFVYLQSAVLYTHQDGTRRIRVHNLCIPLANKLIDLYESIDPEALGVFYLKSTVDKIFKSKKIANSVMSLEPSYKSFIYSVLSTQQSLKKELPDNLISLTVFILGMLKHRICCKDELERKLDIDLSNYLRIKIQKMSVADVMAFIYPRIYPIHSILADDSIGNYDENGVVELPATINASLNAFETDGIYLIDNGFVLILYLKSKCERTLFYSLFKCKDVNDIEGPVIEDNIFSDPDQNLQRIINIVDYIRGTKSLFQNLIIAFEGTDSERIVKESLIEDNYCPWMKMDYSLFYQNTVESNSSSGVRPGFR